MYSAHSKICILLYSLNNMSLEYFTFPVASINSRVSPVFTAFFSKNAEFEPSARTGLLLRPLKKVRWTDLTGQMRA